MLRRLLAFGALVAGAAAGVRVLRKWGRPERVQLFYDDGPFVTLVGDEAEPFFEIARSIV